MRLKQVFIILSVYYLSSLENSKIKGKNKSLNFLPLRDNPQEKDRHLNINMCALNILSKGNINHMATKDLNRCQT